MYVRVASPRYAAPCFFCRSLSSVTPPYRIFLLGWAARMCSTSQLVVRVNLDGNIGAFGIAIRCKPILTF